MREPSEPNLHRQVMTSLKLKAFYIKSFYHQEITSLPRFVGLNPERKDAIVCTAVWTTRTKSPSEKVTKSSSMLTWRMVCLCPRRMGSMAKLKVMLLRELQALPEVHVCITKPAKIKQVEIDFGVKSLTVLKPQNPGIPTKDWRLQ